MLVGIDDDPDVAALVPTMGRRAERLTACLDSLASQQGDVRVAIICILNSSDADLPTVTSSLSGPISIERPGINLGWSGALTLGRSRTSAPLLWLVQDDMVLDARCLRELSAELDRRSDLALVAPLVVENGMVPVGSCGGVLSGSERGPADVDLDHWLPREDTPPADLDLKELATVDYVPSRGTLIRTAVWDEIGGMDPSYYPVQWADIDLCTAVRRAGYGVALARGAVTQHAGKGSTPGYFASFLFDLHRTRFAEKWFGAGVPVPVIDRTIPPQLFDTVAVQATTKLSLLASHVDDELRAADSARAEAARLRTELEQVNEQVSRLLGSRSWRVTAPLRRLGEVARTAAKLRGKADPSR